MKIEEKARMATGRWNWLISQLLISYLKSQGSADNSCRCSRVYKMCCSPGWKLYYLLGNWWWRFQSAVVMCQMHVHCIFNLNRVCLVVKHGLSLLYLLCNNRRSHHRCRCVTKADSSTSFPYSVKSLPHIYGVSEHNVFFFFFVQIFLLKVFSLLTKRIDQIFFFLKHLETRT